ncbi:thioesterase domain-containing protein [Halomonas sp. McH1-25]|uniref:YiiD C-terminal domain-containing protein n=1 Tax=unclassified Halomonas TaxID=2609666 RepID=UPI001EF667D0|nr:MULTISPECIES: YiiD C-terminal domain-containing protein [unclassified Halomonas]MCG7600918.1 thioesterase domain-containing protein [Halomonas sp. McH1-25]MCP1341506.1 thioesterase domain-containing protein [Halomonas sp. FL8]MCP1360097.1 thioesterase domain-containing protein [Halomonas sp. BBD45]
MRQPGIPHPRLPLPAANQLDDLAAFQDWLGEAIPLVGQLGIKGMHWQGESLVWELQLRPNLNDKGTGFGGSFAAQTTLIGWCWITLWLRSRQRAQDVVVAQAGQRFIAPVTGDYRLVCTPRDADAPAMLEKRLQDTGKGRLSLGQQLFVGDTLCLEAEGDYVVLPAASTP